MSDDDSYTVMRPEMARFALGASKGRAETLVDLMKNAAALGGAENEVISIVAQALAAEAAAVVGRMLPRQAQRFPAEAASDAEAFIGAVADMFLLDVHARLQVLLVEMRARGFGPDSPTVQ